MHVLSVILLQYIKHGYVFIYVHRIKIVMNLSEQTSSIT